MIRFYAPDIASTLTLPESDSQHCIRVLRMNLGDEIEVIDGRGRLLQCRIVSPHSKHTGVEILHSSNLPLPWNHHITVAVAPTKHLDRMEWLVEKLTEIGVNRIVPLLCQRSERKEIKVERLEKIAVSAMKQSLKATLPEIQPMTPVSKVLDSYEDAQKFIAYCDPSLPRLSLAREYKPHTSSVVIIGPEGDFSPEEIRGALDRQWLPVTLGENRLRTETAALVACDTFHLIDQLH